MLYLNLNRAFSSRGITNPLSFLANNGFTRAVAFRILHNQQSHLRFQYLQRICELLHCTPNDLFDYIPSNNTGLANNHPLLGLCRPAETISLSGHLQNATPNELNEIEELIRTQKARKT